MKVYIVMKEDNLPSETTTEVLEVLDSFEKAKTYLEVNYHELLKECENGTFIPGYFSEYTAEISDKYWEIRSKIDESIYMSDSIEEFEVK